MSIARVSVQDVEIHFEGDSAHTVVMLHGWPDSYRLWDSTVEALKDRFCCVRFTLPGFDVAAAARTMSLDDMTELLHTIVDEVSPGLPVTLLLHDWGCVFGYEFAARYPQQVARIVAVDIGDHDSAALRASMPAKARLQVLGYQLWLALAWKIGSGPGDWMTRAMARALGCRTDPQLIGARMNYPYAMRWFGSVGGLGGAAKVNPACPLLYLYGERKPFMFHSPQWLARLEASPECAVQAFATGHWIMVQQPQAFNACVRDWLLAATDQQGNLAAG